MHSRLPSLNALRVFEAAARMRSFKAAAEELNVTQSAVSRQIKLLEEQLRTPLFLRLNRNVEPTPAAETLLPCLTRAFLEIGDVTHRISRGRNSPPKCETLVIAATPGIAECWFGSRLGDFIRSFPGIEPEIAVAFSPVESLKARKAEIGIQWDTGDWPEFEQVTLMEVNEFPVCSPLLLRDGPRLEEPNDLKNHRLLHLMGKSSWASWLQNFGVRDVDWNAGPILRDVTLCMNMAISGEGVALGDEILAGDALISGRLIKPLRHSRTLERKMHLLIQRQAVQRPQVKAFADWLIEQIRAYRLETQELRQDRPYHADIADTSRLNSFR